MAREWNIIRATQLITKLYNLNASPLVSIRFWETYLSADDRKRLGDNWRKAHYQDHLTAGMWMRLHGVTPVQATVAIALQLNYVSELSGRRALIDLGEDTNDPEITLSSPGIKPCLLDCGLSSFVTWNRGTKMLMSDWELYNSQNGNPSKLQGADKVAKRKNHPWFAETEEFEHQATKIVRGDSQ